MKQKQYKAFISYSHQDEKFGKWLHKSLEKYKIPKDLKQDYPNLPNSLFPLFRDREELPTSADLGKEISKALKSSEYLIIICSINSAKSQWVNQEIIDFKALHGEDKVRAIIIDGEPHAKDSDKFDDALECFPEALKYKVIDGKLSDIPTEPIAGDFRKGKDGKELGKLKLIAGLLGVNFDDLNRREEKRKKRNRLIWGAFAVGLIVILSGLSVFSFQQRNKAIESEKNALKEKNKAIQKEQEIQYKLEDIYMQKGINLRGNNELLQAKHIFAKAAYLDKNRSKQIKILYNSLNNISLTKILTHENDVNSVFFTKDEQYILTSSNDKKIRLWNRFTGNKLLNLKHKGKVNNAIFNKDESKILSWGSDALIVWNKITGQEILKISILDSFYDLSINYSIPSIYKASFSEDNKKIYIWINDSSSISTRGGRFSIWDIKNKKEIYRTQTKNFIWSIKINHKNELLIPQSNVLKLINLNTKKIISFTHSSFIQNTIFSKNNKYILSWSKNNIKLWNKQTEEELLILKHKDIFGAILNKEENKILSWGLDNTLRLWDITDGTELFQLRHNTSVNNGIFSKNDNFILSYSSETIKLWNLYTGKEVFRFKNIGYILGANFSKSNKYIISWNFNGTVRIWDTNSGEELFMFKHNEKIIGVKFSKDEKTVLSYSKDGTVKIWDIRENRLTINENDLFKNLFFLNKDEILIYNYNSIKILNIKSKKTLFKLIHSYKLEKKMDIITGNENIYKEETRIDGVILTKNKKNILTWSKDGTIKLWNKKK